MPYKKYRWVWCDYCKRWHKLKCLIYEKKNEYTTIGYCPKRPTLPLLLILSKPINKTYVRWQNE
ncbi:hypothetical protein DRO69_10420 [Candidatus Bathyarchaeota archaeon]|nr:MAG: hypothetical protein DRO69_10420 [Candidatus Bathyarchaeota archaeon]